jgi:serine phosphatase RsbU (regulator of sigma subunit)
MVRELSCREIWGGNRAAETAVSTPGLDLYVLSRPFGDGGGGDVYYLSSCESGRVSRIVLADVSGHGAAVAPVAEELRELVRDHVNAFDHTDFVRALNRRFVEASRAGIFATAIVVSYLAPEGRLLVVNAGHPAPLFFRRETESWSLLHHDAPSARQRLANLPLGIVAPTRYRQFAVEVSRGDLVVLYTDALSEATGPDGDALGPRGVLRIASDLDPYEPLTFGRRLVDAVESRAGPCADDTTVIVATPNAAPTT